MVLGQTKPPVVEAFRGVEPVANGGTQDPRYVVPGTAADNKALVRSYLSRAGALPSLYLHNPRHIQNTSTPTHSQSCRKDHTGFA